MKKNLFLSRLFLCLCLFLSHLMCIVVTNQFTSMFYLYQHEVSDVPATIALFYIFPFLLGILICWIMHYYFKRK